MGFGHFAFIPTAQLKIFVTGNAERANVKGKGLEQELKPLWPNKT